MKNIVHRWIHIAYQESSQFSETYGFSGSQGKVNIEGILFEPDEGQSKTLFVLMHPSSTLQLLPLPSALAAAGYPVLCMGSRYAKNDTALIYEKVALDLGATIRYAKETLGYQYVVLLGWSGGGSLALFYQSQAEHPTITATPAGDPVDLISAQLIPADGVLLEAAHRSRARTLCDWIDPSVIDELNPDHRIPELDLYSRTIPRTPPFDPEWLAVYRKAQKQRIHRITTWVLETLEELRQRGTSEVERGFVTHRTMADPRFLDGSIEPNDRPIGSCYLGVPETVNTGPVGLARYSTLRSWLSQWSLEHSRADGESCASQISVPLLAIEHSADDAVPQPDVGLMFQACASRDKEMHVIQGANHYFKGQPEHLAQALGLITRWARRQGW